LVKLKLAGVDTPAIVAVTVYGPPMFPFATKVVEVAMPEALVRSVSVEVAFAKVPLAPVAGAVNVTATPPTGFELASSTVATNGAANAVSTVAVCGVPLVATTVTGDPPAFVKLKLAGVEAPATDAVTV